MGGVAATFEESNCAFAGGCGTAEPETGAMTVAKTIAASGSDAEMRMGQVSNGNGYNWEY